MGNGIRELSERGEKSGRTEKRRVVSHRIRKYESRAYYGAKQTPDDFAGATASITVSVRGILVNCPSLSFEWDCIWSLAFGYLATHASSIVRSSLLNHKQVAVENCESCH